MFIKYSTLLLLCVMSLASAGNETLAASDEQIAYAYRWYVTEPGPDKTVASPLKLLWSKSPVWFEKMNPGGRSESPGRRIADTPEGFVTVMKRTLYLLDKKSGKTLWSFPLEGEEISDWKTTDNLFAYSAINWKTKTYFRGGIDIRQRKQIWAHHSGPRRLTQDEWVLPIPQRGWVYSSNHDAEISKVPLEFHDYNSGEIRWSQPKGLKPYEDKPSTWFTYDKTLNALVGVKEGGLYVQPYNSSTGEKLEILHMYGKAKIGNLFVPLVVTPDGTLFTVYDALTDKRGPDGFYRSINSIVAYDLKAKKLLWETQVLDGKEAGSLSIKQVALARKKGSPLFATSRPNRYLLLNSENGTILRKGTIAGYEEWTGLNALLYSYPYLYTSARRALAKGFAYDLIALNLETGKIDWSYEIDKEDSKFSTAAAEILNFIVLGNKVYMSRADGKIMCFQAQKALSP